ncbi:CPBP family intramembrane glutamic endopeptidase [Pedobacter rhodius]|uniref:Type II CAAX endopeptidase family protein n=1 Tax=Pedobacter rhodius TaxID=3004098 RepID=A0ABT4KVA4_9SPHI|nr:type II CAAX endopeptidase family protein [Pedobacter sp. SJ11]MCZ4222864.1 type II CAAX endopeptidase family protein [Pedobacter sp. SJ11]
MENKFLYYLKPIIRVVIFVLFIFLWSIPFGFLTQFEVFKFSQDSLSGQLFYEFGAVLIVTGALLMVFQTFPTRNFETVFITQNAFFPFLKGSALGLLLIGCCSLIMYLTGNVAFTETKILPLNIAGYLLFFIMAGLFEEFTFRSFPLVVFAERYSIPVSIFLNGFLFGLIHLSNPDFSMLAMLNISLCGILFSMITLLKRNIWWAVGIHFGWNFTQGNLLGFKVSGISQPGLIMATPKGNAILSGGAFGIEGSIICTFILMICVILLIIKTRIKPVLEIENNHEFDRKG